MDNSLAGLNEWQGVSLADANGNAASAVLVSYTFYGDADLNGAVDFENDYIQWQTGFVNHYAGWQYGDFDYSGVVDFETDYIQWQTVFVNQPALPGAPAAFAAAAVPEPGTLVLIGLGLAALARRGPVAAAGKCQ